MQVSGDCSLTHFKGTAQSLATLLIANGPKTQQSRFGTPLHCFKLHMDTVQLLGQIPDSNIPLLPKVNMQNKYGAITVGLVLVLRLITQQSTINDFSMLIITENRASPLSVVMFFTRNVVGLHQPYTNQMYHNKRVTTYVCGSDSECRECR